MILVTGATGTVGSQLVKLLAERDVSFRAAVHSRPLRIRGVQTYSIDYRQPHTIVQSMQGVRSVFAVFPLTFEKDDMFAAARNLLRSAEQAGVRHVVKLSAYGAAEEGYPHAAWHRQIERSIEESGMAWTFLRPNAFMQTLFEGWGGTIRSEDTFYDSIETAGYAPIDARDIARVAAHVLTEPGHDGKAYELTGPEALSWFQAAKVLTRVLGRPIRYHCLSDAKLQQNLVEEGLSEEIADAWLAVHRYVRQYPSAVTAAVKDVTGKEATAFHAFCREFASQLLPDTGG